MIFPTFFSRYKKYRVYDEQGRLSLYTLIKTKAVFRIEKMFFDPDGK